MHVVDALCTTAQEHSPVACFTESSRPRGLWQSDGVVGGSLDSANRESILFSQVLLVVEKKRGVKMLLMSCGVGQ